MYRLLLLAAFLAVFPFVPCASASVARIPSPSLKDDAVGIPSLPPGGSAVSMPCIDVEAEIGDGDNAFLVET